MAPRSIKDDLHRLVEELPETELRAAKRFLEYLRNHGDPVVKALLEAPIDYEGLAPTEEDQEAQEAWQEYLRGEARPWEEVRKELADG